MPEVTFRLRWPDETEMECYSPSTVVRVYFDTGQTYKVGAFAALAHHALTAASERVERKFGHPCTRAHATLAAIERRSKACAGTPDATVTFLGFIE